MGITRSFMMRKKSDFQSRITFTRSWIFKPR
ncbi:Protein of unknown function [Pyronema omphalodes CBS 100304]|uniref:Uncharacterized protein n=1 Tax=Pyronema omphalodes (strain CBS 100304) TaxID=1076935 RepID=U4LQK0_PYROM|nr:Protein of unknown function [Pyronema omphalodes CBS 100304]